MQLLAVAGVYDPGSDSFSEAFQRLVHTPPSGFVVLEGNAGLGADWPAAIWKSAQALAVAVTIISAPATIKENWPIWKEIFDQATEYMLEHHGEFRIDRDTAQVLAIQHAVAELGMDATELMVHLAIRHYHQSIGGYEDLLLTERVDMDWIEGSEWGSTEFSAGVRSNEEAARQVLCRYVFGIGDLSRSQTIVVEMDGTVSFEKKLCSAVA